MVTVLQTLGIGAWGVIFGMYVLPPTTPPPVSSDALAIVGAILLVGAWCLAALIELVDTIKAQGKAP